MKSFKTILAAALGGFQYGYGVAVIAGVILFLSGEFHLTPRMQGLVVSILLVGAFLGSPLAGMCADKFGRKKTLGLTAIMLLVGSLWASMAHTIPSLLCARALQGLSLGIVGIIAPLYLAEMAPAKQRGAWVSCNQLSVTFGILVAYICNYYWEPVAGWRNMLAFAAVPAFIQIIILFFASESPVWEQKASTKEPSWKALFESKYRRIVGVGLCLSMFQQITGINAVLYFAPRIFSDAGFSSVSGAILATAGIGLIQFLATIFALWLVDRVGRKPLLLTSVMGMTFSLVFLATSLFVQSVFIDTIAVVTLMTYVGFYAIGMGPVPSLVLSEIFPFQLRGRGMSLASVVTWIFNFIVAFTFLELTSLISTGGVFLLFALFGIVALLFTWKFIPETKGISLEDVAKKISTQ